MTELPRICLHTCILAIVALYPPAALVPIGHPFDNPEASAIRTIDNRDIADPWELSVAHNGKPADSAEGREH